MVHASLTIGSGKIEGINHKTKVIRNQAYGIPDDEYLFLKVLVTLYQNSCFFPTDLMDSNPKSALYT